MIETLSRRERGSPERFGPIAPGSKRLITPDGTFGDNSDVIPGDLRRRSGGAVYGGSGRGWHRRGWTPAGITLDAVLFEDGLCAGPDTSDTFNLVRADMAMQQSIAAELVAMIREGASPGQIFERLLPDARPLSTAPPKPGDIHRLHARQRFAESIVSTYIRRGAAEVSGWLEKLAAPPPIELRRA